MSADPLLAETAEKVFAARSGYQVVEQAEHDRWAGELWEAVSSLGLPWVSIPEAAGGSGGSVVDAVTVLRVAGSHAAPIPLAETGMLGGWLLAQCGLPIPPGPVTVAPTCPPGALSLARGSVTGTVHRVPWAQDAERIVLLIDGATDLSAGHATVVSVSPANATVVQQSNLAGEPRDTVVFDGTPIEDLADAPAGVDAASFRRRGALTRAALTAGALQALSRLTLRYADGRLQFGRPIASFQAVQSHLLRVAEDAALVSLAVDAAAAAAAAAGTTSAIFEIAAAKSLACAAASTATKAAHQVHGAMGMTREYQLHHLTRRLYAWRPEYGGEREWAGLLGGVVASTGPDDLYALITAGSVGGLSG